MTTTTSDPLEQIKRAAVGKRRTEHAYRSALVAARAAGYSYSEIARAAGISRQSARVIVLRAEQQTC